MKIVRLTATKLKQLKAALQRAQAAGKDRYDTFELDGSEYVVGYADYLVEYLETRLGAR